MEQRDIFFSRYLYLRYVFIKFCELEILRTMSQTDLRFIKSTFTR